MRQPRRFFALLALTFAAPEGTCSFSVGRRRLATVLRLGGGAGPDAGWHGSPQSASGSPSRPPVPGQPGEQRPPPPKPPPRPPEPGQQGGQAQQQAPPRPQQPPQPPPQRQQPTPTPQQRPPARQAKPTTRSSPGAIQPGPGVDFAALERASGVRLSWHLWPHPAGADALGAPLGLLFSPMSHIDGLQTLKHEPTTCGSCNAALNPFAQVDPQLRRWRCPLCGSWTPFDAQLASARSAPLETSPEHATVEYELGVRDDTPAAVLLALDCSVRPDELAHLEATVAGWLRDLPPDTPVGLVTYGDSVEVHELAFGPQRRIWHLPHELAELPLAGFKRLLGFPDADDSAGDADADAPGGAPPPQQAQQQQHSWHGHPGMPPPQDQYPPQGFPPQGMRGMSGQGPPQGYPGGYPGAPPGYAGGYPGYPGGAPPGYGGPMGATPGMPQQQQRPGFAPSQGQAQWQGTAGGARASPSPVEDLHLNAERFFVPAGEFDLSAALQARASACAARKAAPQPAAQQLARPPQQQMGGPGGFGAQGYGYPGGSAGGGSGWPGEGPAGPRPGSIAALAAAAAAAEAEEEAAAAAAAGEAGKRVGRCTGSAVAAAVSLLASCQADGAARLVTFTGGPSVGGAGAIVDADAGSAVRSHAELQGGSARAKAAAAHYDRVARAAAARGHGVDVVSASLDETGLYEMRALVQRTGGTALQVRRRRIDPESLK